MWSRAGDLPGVKGPVFRALRSCPARGAAPVGASLFSVAPPEVVSSQQEAFSIVGVLLWFSWLLY